MGKSCFALCCLIRPRYRARAQEFLAQAGQSIAEIKRMSPGLVELLALARKRKLGREVKLSRLHLGAIRALDATYSSNQLRYIVTGATVVLQVALLAQAAEGMVVGVEYYCTGYRGHA
jgi:hypothetical protein